MVSLRKLNTTPRFRLAFQSLQNIMADIPGWRDDVMRGYVTFIQREVPDTAAQILEQCSRRLNLLLTHWKTVAQFFSVNKVSFSSLPTSEVWERRVTQWAKLGVAMSDKVNTSLLTSEVCKRRQSDAGTLNVAMSDANFMLMPNVRCAPQFCSQFTTSLNASPELSQVARHVGVVQNVFCMH